MSEHLEKAEERSEAKDFNGLLSVNSSFYGNLGSLDGESKHQNNHFDSKIALN